MTALMHNLRSIFTYVPERDEERHQELCLREHNAEQCALRQLAELKRTRMSYDTRKTLPSRTLDDVLGRIEDNDREMQEAFHGNGEDTSV